LTDIFKTETKVLSEKEKDGDGNAKIRALQEASGIGNYKKNHSIAIADDLLSVDDKV